jgi:hypothetical protein
MSNFQIDDLPEGFEPAPSRTPARGTIRVPGQQQGLDHFRWWGAALDQALSGMENANNDQWSIALTATVQPAVRADGADPGIVIEYTATVM